MGLDINIGVNNDNIVFSEDYYNEENGNYEKHSSDSAELHSVQPK
jgi:hypothetical protein